MSFDVAKARRDNPVVQTPQSCIDELVNNYLEPAGENGIPSLSIKGECEKHKADAAACCSNPNNCAGLAMDIAKTSAPVLPGLFSAYKQYRTSEKVSSGELSHEEAQAKVCDANNKTAVGAFAGQLFSQMSTMFETKCKDKIEDCQEDCNGQLEAFKEHFKKCFSHVPSNGTVEGIINIAKQCAKNIEDIKNVPNTLNEARTRYNPCSISTIDYHIISRLSSKCTSNRPRNTPVVINDCKGVKKEDIGYILLFTKAYKNSSALEKFPFEKMEELSENSDETKIVNCSHQPDRVVSQKNHPGRPISPPYIQLCQAVTDPFRYGSPSPQPPMPGISSPGSNTTAGFTGQLPETKQGDYPGWMYPGEGDGAIPDIPDSKSFPTPGKLSGSPSGGSSSSSPAAGIAGSSGGGSGPSSKDKSGSGYPYPRSGGDYDSFSGGYGGYQNTDGRRDHSAPYRQAASGEKDTEEKTPFPERDKKEDMDQEDSNSIFQTASRRIQTFCSDHSCIE